MLDLGNGAVITSQVMWSTYVISYPYPSELSKGSEQVGRDENRFQHPIIKTDPATKDNSPRGDILSVSAIDCRCFSINVEFIK